MADYTFTHVSNANFTTRVTLTNAGVGVVSWSATFIRSSTAWKSWNVNTSTNRPEFSFALGGVGFSGFYTYDFRDGSGQGLERAMGSGSISVPSGSTLTLTGTNDPKGSMGIATVPAGQTFTTQSAPPPPPPATPVWSTATALAAATRGTAYSRTVVASPVTGYSIQSQSGSPVPTGTYSINNSGVITGTPTATGLASITVRATNSGSTADRTFTFTVNPALPIFSDASVASPAISGNPYLDAVAASEAESYSVRNSTNTGVGTLPDGLTLITTGLGAGTIGGIPTTAGTTEFRIRATNVTGSTDTEILTITVISGAKVWNGTAFVAGTTKVWDGTSFVSSTTRVWNGSAWVSST
jgi:hypothetical protein